MMSDEDIHHRRLRQMPTADLQLEVDHFEIDELGTEGYCSLEDAQRAALPHLAELLASMVRQGIEEGRFVVVDGVVRLAQRCESQGLAERGFTNGENDV